MQTETENKFLRYLPLDRVHVQPGFNPRKFFDDAEYRELTESVRQNGVLQPVVVRPIPDRPDNYWIVAGERRYRAAKDANLVLIPAAVRDLTDHEAMVVATIENTQRANMSPAEEAEAARTVLMGCGNDRQEAMRLLGWSQKKFESRLLLLHADPEVLEALAQRKIKLGHAELLSQLPRDFQTATLAKIIEHGYSVADLRDRLAAFALDLSKAIFDISGCANCPHNSTMQASLFEEHIASGKCANRECFQAKSQSALDEKKRTLSEQYAVVYLDTERPPNSYTILCQQGPQGVGKHQFERGCRQCAHYGALLMTSPDRLGEVKEDCCFDLGCHQKKVDEYRATSSVATQVRRQDQSGMPSRTTGRIAKGATAASGTADSGNPKAKAASASALPGKVVEAIETFYRTLSAKIAPDDPRAVLCLDTFALYRFLAASAPSTLLPDAIQDKALHLTNLDAFVNAVYPLEPGELVAFHHRLLVHLLSRHEKTSSFNNKPFARGAAALVKHAGIDLSDHFVLERDFLAAFTKSGMEVVLREAVNDRNERFVEYYESRDEKTKFPTLIKKKTSEILDEVFGCGFDFGGFVPSCVSGYLGDDKSKTSSEQTATATMPVTAVASAQTEESRPLGLECEDQAPSEFEYTEDPEESADDF
ncbi:PRTRC system ParB family protein [Methylocaldum sp.]|uniref:PRTRC system ParB family protein n=1 Tax=Methylocaldum sp. TaxID=1969727 RepID=UPI0032208C4F